MPIHIVQEELEIKYMEINLWRRGCSPSADVLATRRAQNFINKAALWDHFYPFCSIFPHLLFFWYTPSLHFQVYYIYNKAQAAPELVQGPPEMQAKSCAALALTPRGGSRGREVSRKGWKKAGGFRVSHRFPTSSLASGTAPPPASLALPAEPQNCRGDGKQQGWGTAPQEQGWRRESTAIETSHQGSRCRDKLTPDADSCAPEVNPERLGQVAQRGADGARWDTLPFRQDSAVTKKGGSQRCITSNVFAWSLCWKLRALPAPGSSVNTADIFQPCTVTRCGHRPFTSFSRALPQPPAQREEKSALQVFQGSKYFLKNLFPFF